MKEGSLFCVLPNKATLSGVLRFLKAFGVPLGLISGGKETLVPATHLLGRVCVSLFGETREIPPHTKKHASKGIPPNP